MRTLQNSDDVKVSAQDRRTVKEIEKFINYVYTGYNVDIKYLEPDDLFCDYDLIAQVKHNYALGGKTIFIIESKERSKHFADSCMIDVPKIDNLMKLQNGNKALNRRLFILEPQNGKIYVFNLNTIDWKNTKRDWRLVPKSNLRYYKNEKVWKEFYFIDWSLARVFNYDGWSDETKLKVA